MPADKMTPVERWQAVLRREKPDRLPMDYWGTDEATAALILHLGCASKEETLCKLHVDYVVKVAPRYIGPKLRSDEDVFGRRFRDIDYGTGAYRECIHHPLAGFRSIGEVERNYAWPSPDWWDYGDIPDQIRGNEMYPIQGGGSEPYLIYKELRGDEQALVDFIENPEIAHYLLDKLFDLAYEDTRRTLEQARGGDSSGLCRRGHGRPIRPAVLARPYPEIPVARHEADYRPRPPGGRLCLPPQRRILPPDHPRHD